MKKQVLPLFVVALLLPPLCFAEVEEMKTPAEWLRETLAEREAEGWKISEVFPDVLAAGDPAENAREYFLRIESEEKIPFTEWAEQAMKGRTHPAARAPFERLAKGYMLYEGRLGLGRGDGQLTEETKQQRREVFREMKNQGINSLVYVTYITPEEWPELQIAAEESDLDLIIQYNAAYYDPENQPHTWENPDRAKHRKERARTFLKAVFDHQDGERLAGFSIREEPYVSTIPGMQEYHDFLREGAPGVNIYTLYNTPGPAEATREPAPEIMGTDLYPFLGAYLSASGPNSERPLFVSPQAALRTLAARMRPFAEAAMERGAVFTYTPALAGYNNTFQMEEVEKRGWPAEGYPGIIKAPDGRVFYWRRYTPPAEAVRASTWIAAAYGALGWFPWPGHSQWSMPWLPPDEHFRPDLKEERAEFAEDVLVLMGRGIQTDQRPPWQAYLSSLEEVSAFEPLLLKLRLDPMPRVESEDGLLVTTSHRIVGEDNDSRVLMLVNLDVGRWQDYPRVDARTRNLDLTPDGDLVGFEPFEEPREVEFTVRLQEGERLYDIRTGKALEPWEQAGSGKQRFLAPVEPGGARCCLQEQMRSSSRASQPQS